MKKCDAYVKLIEKKWDPIKNEIEEKNCGVCLGTKEIDACKCEGNEGKCDFYPEKRRNKTAETLSNSLMQKYEIRKVVEKFDKELNKKHAKKSDRVKQTGPRIYYAHHQWKYGTKVEEFEIEMIRKAFPKMDIFNPATDLKTDGLSEEEIMKQCLKEVDTSDFVVFTTMDGYIGKGVLEEIRHAQSNGKVVLWFIAGNFRTDFGIDVILIPISDRLYATVYSL